MGTVARLGETMLREDRMATASDIEEEGFSRDSPLLVPGQDRPRGPPPLPPPNYPPRMSGDHLVPPWMSSGPGAGSERVDGRHDDGVDHKQMLKKKLEKKKGEVSALLLSRAEARHRYVPVGGTVTPPVDGSRAPEPSARGMFSGKRKKKHKRSRDSSTDSSSSSSERRLFRTASSNHRKGGSQFRDTHQCRPGRLMASGFDSMRTHLDPKLVGGGDEASGNPLQGCATAYHVNVVQTRPSPLGQRNEREMRTLAQGLDNLAAGRLAEVGDVLMQRYKAVELAATEGNWDLAQRLEVIPDTRPAAVSHEERHAAAAEELTEQKLRSLMAANRIRTRPDDKKQPR